MPEVSRLTTPKSYCLGCRQRRITWVKRPLIFKSLIQEPPSDTWARCNHVPWTQFMSQSRISWTRAPHTLTLRLMGRSTSFGFVETVDLSRLRPRLGEYCHLSVPPRRSVSLGKR